MHQLSDEDIVLGVARLSTMYRRFGISSSEALKGFRNRVSPREDTIKKEGN